MDALPPIRNLSLTQQRIREALKNAKPLNITRKSDDFVVFEEPKKSDENSLFNRFLRHRTTNNCPENETKKINYKWFQLKDKMEEELEIKRMESIEKQQIIDKMENEELDEEVNDELEECLKENDDNTNNDTKSTQSDNSSDVSDEEKDDAEEVIDAEDDGDQENSEEDQDDNDEEEEDMSDEEEEEESDRESNPFVDDEAEDDEEIIKDVNEGIERHSDESNDSLVVSNRQKEKPLSPKESNEENIFDNPLDTSFNIFDESFERRAATQKIALSPFITQKPKPRFDSKNDFSELISDFNLNNEEFNSQSLLDLCSGNFEQNKQRIESYPNNDSDNEEKDCESDPEDDPVMSRPKKVFNIESDNESDNEDNQTEKKTTKEINSLKSFNESDGEELIITDEDECGDGVDGEEEEEEGDDLEEHNVNSFFDNEAELSGNDDVSSDEDDVDDNQDNEEEEAQEDLPSDTEIEEQNKKYFNKQILDEEKRNIMLWKERLFEDGDLHDDGKQREKKFRWNFEANDNFVNDYINEDSDDNYMDSDEDEKTKTPTLKMFDKTEDKLDSKIENRIKMDLKNNFDLKNLNKNLSSAQNNGSISQFVLRDQRLKTVMSFENKRSLKSKISFKSNKKFKSSKENTRKSIFDLMNP